MAVKMIIIIKCAIQRLAGPGGAFWSGYCRAQDLLKIDGDAKEVESLKSGQALATRVKLPRRELAPAEAGWLSGLLQVHRPPFLSPGGPLCAKGAP